MAKRYGWRKNWPLFVILFLLIVLLAIIFAIWYWDSHSQKPKEVLSIAAWNLQIFGDKKESDVALLSLIKEKISPYDIVFLQEIRDADGSSAQRLCSLFWDRICLISDRAGRSNSKEQYVLILRNDTRILSWTDFTPELQDVFERPPLLAHISIQNYTLVLVGTHVKPDDARNEILALESLIDYVVGENQRVIVLGDMNADCSYYDRDRDDGFDRWRWVIDADTTTGKSVCAYDRILINGPFSHEIVDAGVDMVDIDSSVSDHGIVWVKLAVFD